MLEMELLVTEVAGLGSDRDVIGCSLYLNFF
jgi:hypothetical protein